MTNKEEVKNVHTGEQSEIDAVLQKKATELVALLKSDPKASLVPVLKVTEQGIIPDVRLVLNKEEDEDASTETKEGDKEDATEDRDTTADAEPSSA